MRIPIRFLTIALTATLVFALRPSTLYAASTLVGCAPDATARGAALVSAIVAANATPGDDVVELTPGCTYSLLTAYDADNGGTGLPPIAAAGGALTLIGNDSTVERDADAPPFRLLSIPADAHVIIDHLTLRNGLLSDWVNYGAGIYSEGTLTLRNSTVRENHAAVSSTGLAESYGGGIYNGGTLLVDHSLISNNSVFDSGGVINESDGGGIYNAGTATLTASTITGNRVSSDGYGRSVGAGVANDGTLAIASCTFEDNDAVNGYGGGLLTSGATTVKDSFFSGNQAPYAGAIYANRTTVEIVGTRFETNLSWYGDGGAIQNEQGSVTVVASTFMGNHANQSGGAISSVGVSSVPNNGVLKIAQSTFYQNSSDRAGAVYADEGTFELTDSTLVANHASTVGGLLVVSLTDATISSSTFVDNLSDAWPTGGVVAASDAVFHNILVADNLGAGGAPGNCSGLHGSTDSISTDATCAGFRSVPSASLKLDPNGLQANGGMTETIALLPGSPAIDAGNASLLPHDTLDLDGDLNTAETLPVDQRGAPRLSGVGLDVGAFEYNPYLPVITSQPESQAVYAGQPVQLSVSATGENLSYQWYQGHSGDTNSPVSGATEPILSMASVSASARYWVRVSNAAGSADSATAQITLLAPVIPSLGGEDATEPVHASAPPGGLDAPPPTPP